MKAIQTLPRFSFRFLKCGQIGRNILSSFMRRSLQKVSRRALRHQWQYFGSKVEVPLPYVRRWKWKSAETKFFAGGEGGC